MTMNDSSRYQQGRGQAAYPAQGNGQQPRAAEADAPDFMQLAAMQLRQVIAGIDARAEELARQEGGGNRATAEWAQDVRDARLAVADRLIALAEIQYAIPPDDDPDDDGDLDDGDYTRR